MATAATVTRLFIGGEWVEAESGEAAEATSPATGESLGPVAQADRDDAKRAIEAARDAFPKWAAATAFEGSGSRDPFRPAPARASASS